MKTLEQQAYDIVFRLAKDPVSDIEDVLYECRALAPKLARKEPPPTTDEIDQFNQFRLEYKKGGTVKGCMIEMKHLTKHKDWRDILPELIPNLERQRKERKAMADAHIFVPEWKHLSTYLNQRAWEMIYFSIPEEKYELNEWYLNYLRVFVSQKFSLTDVVHMALSERQFQDYKDGIGYFSIVDREWSHDRKREEFIKSHEKFFSDGLVRQKHLTVGAYIKFKLTGK